MAGGSYQVRCTSEGALFVDASTSTGIKIDGRQAMLGGTTIVSSMEGYMVGKVVIPWLSIITHRTGRD